MEIALLVALFLIGTVGGAIQAMKYLERRQQGPSKRSDPESRDKPGDRP